MRRHPFVVGYVVSSAGLGVLFGARNDFETAFYAGVLLTVTAAIGSFVASCRPGLDGSAGQLWVMAVAGNPAVLVLLLAVLQTPMCMSGMDSASCTLNLLAWTCLPIAFVTPLFGFAWRWWKERS